MKLRIATVAMMAIMFFTSVACSAAQTHKPNNPAKPSTNGSSRSGKEGTEEDVFKFYQEISQSSVKELTDNLEDWSEDNPGKPFRLMLNSPGGDVFASFAMVDELNHLRGKGHKLTIVVYGMAASAAGYVFQAADKRIMGANSMILIHEISSATTGKLSSMKDSVAFDEKLQNRFLNLLVRHSRLTLSLIHSHIDNGRDWWLDAQEAKRYGLVDEIESVPLPIP